MMLSNNVRNEFLGCMSAITVHNTYEFEGMKQFMGIEGLFTKEGNIAQQMNCSKFPATIYRDTEGMYVNCAEAEYLRSMHYNIYDYDRVQEKAGEQLNFFGDETSSVIRQPDESLMADPLGEEPIEAEAKIVENELTLDEVFKYVEIGTVTPAKCEGQLLEYKDKIIDFVGKYENIVVTKDNYAELKNDVFGKFNGKISDLKSQRARFNNEVKQFTDPYSKAFSEIINALEKVKGSLGQDIKVFEDEEKLKIKNKLLDETINPTLDIMASNGIIDDKTRAEFQFNDKWTNASARTKTGNLTKKTTDEINAELNRLSEMYAQKQKDIETIKSTVSNLASAHGVDEEALKADTYIDLYNRGVDMPGVQQRINADLENIKRAVEREKEKARIEAEKKQREALQRENVKSVQNTMTEEKVPENSSQEEMFNLVDEKTGEVVAVANTNKIVAKRIDTPEQLKDKTYTYVYEFSGDFGAIKTFSNMLKILSKISNFKYARK